MPTKSERSKNRKYRKTPAGTKIVRKKSRQSKQHCAVCKRRLAGTPKGGVSGIRKLAKTKRRPTAAFGGVLCNRCKRLAVEQSFLVKEKAKKSEDISPEIRKYAEMVGER